MGGGYYDREVEQVPPKQILIHNQKMLEVYSQKSN